MKQPHKHAALIKAWADGAEIEYWGVYDNRWFDATCPDWNPDVKYRIKPEPKPDVVVLEGVSHSQRYGAILGSGLKPNIRLTFDGETGKLKKAEVLK